MFECPTFLATLAVQLVALHTVGTIIGIRSALSDGIRGKKESGAWGAGGRRMLHERLYSLNVTELKAEILTARREKILKSRVKKKKEGNGTLKQSPAMAEQQ